MTGGSGNGSEETASQMQATLQALQGLNTMDVAAASLIETFRGDGTGPSVRSFFESIENAAILGRWKPQYRVTAVKLKSKGAAEAFLSSAFDFTKVGADGLPVVDYDTIKRACYERFTSKKNDQFHYRQLQMACQKPGESIAQFAERIRSLGQLTIAETDDPEKRKILEEEAQRRMLCSFLAGLIGKPAEVVRYRFPDTFQKAIDIAKLVEIEVQSGSNDNQNSGVYVVKCFKCGRFGHTDIDCRVNLGDNTTMQQRNPRRGGFIPRNPGQASYRGEQSVGQRYPSFDASVPPPNYRVNNRPAWSAVQSGGRTPPGGRNGRPNGRGQNNGPRVGFAGSSPNNGPVRNQGHPAPRSPSPRGRGRGQFSYQSDSVSNPDVGSSFLKGRGDFQSPIRSRKQVTFDSHRREDGYRPNPRQGTAIQCYRCGRLGHIARDCKMPNRDSENGRGPRE